MRKVDKEAQLRQYPVHSIMQSLVEGLRGLSAWCQVVELDLYIYIYICIYIYIYIYIPPAHPPCRRGGTRLEPRRPDGPLMMSRGDVTSAFFFSCAHLRREPSEPKRNIGSGTSLLSDEVVH